MDWPKAHLNAFFGDHMTHSSDFFRNKAIAFLSSKEVNDRMDGAEILARFGQKMVKESKTAQSFDGSRPPLLNDQSPNGKKRYQIAREAFRFHDPTREFENLNPMVQEDWLQKVEAIAKAIDTEVHKMFMAGGK